MSIKTILTLALAAAAFVLNEVLFFEMLSDPSLSGVFVATLYVSIDWGRIAVGPALRELEEAARRGVSAAGQNLPAFAALASAALGIFLYLLLLCQRYVLALAQQALHPQAFLLWEVVIDPAILGAVPLYLARMFLKMASEEDEDERRP